MSYLCKQVQKLVTGLILAEIRAEVKQEIHWKLRSQDTAGNILSDEHLFQCVDDSEKCLRAHQMGSKNAYKRVLIWSEAKKDPDKEVTRF